MFLQGCFFELAKIAVSRRLALFRMKKNQWGFAAAIPYEMNNFP